MSESTSLPPSVSTPSATRVRLRPLGGVGRFGRNCLLVEVVNDDGTPGDAIVIDCGVRFLGDDAPGYDVGLPDLERIGALGERLRGYVVTHGHEDHIGGMPYALRERAAPVVTTAWTARLLHKRCQRHGVDRPPIDVVAFGEARQLGAFGVRLLAVSHSIPDAACAVIETPAGVIVHSGDFRVDRDPVLGPPTDLAGLSVVGDAGVACLLADSTGALSPGHNAGERSVRDALEAAMADAPGRVVVALFASHLQRLALVADVARAQGRRLGLWGRGLLETRALAEHEGRLQLGDVIADERLLATLPPARQVWCVTGTQGEDNAALGRLANEDPSLPALARGDRVVVSARVIPGNELRVGAQLEKFAERGIDVVDGRNAPHVSGHGHQGDLEELLVAVRPRTFVALHGNPRNLLAHGALARSLGLHDDNVVGLRDGGALLLTRGGGVVVEEQANSVEPFATEHGHVDWFPRGNVDARKRMARGGVLVIAQGDPPRLVPRAIVPPMSPALQRAIVDAVPAAFAARGTPDEAGAIRALCRHFWRDRRVAPEIVLLPVETEETTTRDA